MPPGIASLLRKMVPGTVQAEIIREWQLGGKKKEISMLIATLDEHLVLGCVHGAPSATS